MAGMGGRLTREGTRVYIQLIHTVVQQKLTQHCKAIIFQLKKKRNTPVTLLCSTESSKYISHWKGTLPRSGREASLLPGIENWGLRRLFKQTSLLH